MEDIQTNDMGATPEARVSRLKSTATIAIAFIAIIGVLGAGYAFYTGMFSNEETGAVASVNGIEIPRENYENNIRTLVENAATLGYNVEDPAVQEQIATEAVNSLINGELLLQDAEANGVTVSDTDVDAEFASLETQLGGAEALQAELEASGFTEAELREDIHDQLVIRKHVESKIAASSITVSEEEIQNAYNQLVAAGYTLPDISEVRTTIEAEVRASKEQAALATVLESLRTAATIEILI